MYNAEAIREADQLVYVHLPLKTDIPDISNTITKEEQDKTSNQLFNLIENALSDTIIALTLYEDIWDFDLDNNIGYFEFSFSAKIEVSGDYNTNTDSFRPKIGLIDYHKANELKNALKKLPTAKYMNFSEIWIDIDENHIEYGEFIDIT